MLPLLISLSLASWGAETRVGSPPSAVVRTLNAGAWSATTTGWDDAFLAAWQDYRFAGQSVVMVTRISGDGGIEDPIGIVASGFRASRPALSASGNFAAVAWEANEEARVRLLRRDGQWATPEKRVGGRCPAVAIGQQAGLIVSEQGALRAVRFDSTGVTEAPFDLSTVNPPWGTCARIALDDSQTNALVVWRDGNTQEVYGVTVPLLGPMGPTAPVTFASGSVRDVVLVAAGNGQWFGVTAATPAPPMVHLEGFSLTLPSGPVSAPFLADNGWLQLELARCADSVCFLATNDGANIVLSAGQMPLDGGAPSVISQQNTNGVDLALAATRDGQRLAVASADYTHMRVSTASSDFSSPLPFVTLDNGQPAQLEPDVAAKGDTALVAWLEQDGTGVTVVRGQRFDKTGTALDATPLTLITPGGGEELSEVELMPSPTGWLVAASSWGNERSWLGSVDSAGVVGPSRQLGVRGMHLGFVRTAEGDVLASAKQYQTMWWDPVMVTISPDGGEVTTRMQDTGPKEHYTDVAVTGTGERLVVWQDVDPNGMLDGIVAGKRVAPDGTVLDADALRFTPSGTGSQEGLEPQVVGDGASGYFLVSRSYRQLWAQHIANGVATAPQPLLAAPADGAGGLHLSASGDGKAVVAFSDSSDGGVMARELSMSSGTLTVTPLEPLADVPFDTTPAFAVGEGVVWATWARADTTDNTMRVFVRSWLRLSAGAACNAGWNCDSNACESGACLARATPMDGGVIVLPDGGMMLPDGGVLLSDGGVGASRSWNLQLGPSCSAVDGVSVMALVTLLALRRRRRGADA